MKPLLLLLTLACLTTLPSWSQNSSSLHLSLGGALPVGAFASKDANDPASGLDNIGGLAELGYAYRIKQSHWGLTANIRGRTNAIDKKANTSVLQEAYPMYTWSASNSHWKVLSAMGGAFYMIPTSLKLEVRTGLSLGIAKCYLPDFNILGVLDTAQTGPSGFIQAKVSKVNTTAFTASARAGIVYHLSKHLQFLADLDFWYLKPTFKNVTQTVIKADGLVVPYLISPSNAQVLSVTPLTSNYKQSMNTLNLTVGLAFSFSPYHPLIYRQLKINFISK